MRIYDATYGFNETPLEEEARLSKSDRFMMIIHDQFFLVSETRGIFRDEKTHKAKAFDTFEEAYRQMLLLNMTEFQTNQELSYWQIKKESAIDYCANQNSLF